MRILNKLANLYDTIYLGLYTFICTAYMRIICKIRGVEAEKSKFIGLATFKKGSNNSIVIGRNCRFRSSPSSNLIGVNRKCIITSIGDESSLRIGNNCGFSGTSIGCFNSISIGNNVMVGANSLITDSDWHLDDYRSSGPKPIIIEDNVWIGVNCTILKGVTLGENSVIGAGSVVVKDIPRNVIAGGNPCKIIKSIVESNE